MTSHLSKTMPVTHPIIFQRAGEGSALDLIGFQTPLSTVHGLAAVGGPNDGGAEGDAAGIRSRTGLDGMKAQGQTKADN